MERIRAIVLGAGFPLALVVLWHVAVVSSGTKLVPTPWMVAVMMRDFAFGGVYDDAFSKTILIHLLASMQRVYGGVFLAGRLRVALRPGLRSGSPLSPPLRPPPAPPRARPRAPPPSPPP